MLFNEIMIKKSAGIAIVMVLLTGIFPSCTNDNSVTVPQNENLVTEKELETSDLPVVVLRKLDNASFDEIGSIHNEVLKRFLTEAVMNELFEKRDDEGWRVPWEEARHVLCRHFNEVLANRGFVDRLTEEDLDKLMRKLIGFTRKMSLDPFHPESFHPKQLMDAAKVGFLSKNGAARMSRTIERVINNSNSPLLLTNSEESELQDYPLMDSIFRHSVIFWRELYGDRNSGRAIVTQDEDKDSDNSGDNGDDGIWDDVKEWFSKNKQEVEIMYVAVFDTVGVFYGSSLGIVGAVGGCVIMSGAGMISWNLIDGGDGDNGDGTN